MKKALAMACALCLAITPLAGTALAADAESTTAVTGGNASGYGEPLPVNVIRNPDNLEISKVYELSPGADPAKLPRGDFEQNGYVYTCADILREVVIGEENKTVTVAETAESRKNDTDTVLNLFPQYLEYSDEDGFVGNLLLNTATVRSEVSGYGSSSTPYTVTRSYPNLSDADTRYVPKTIDDNGRTLRLQNVEWQSDNTMNAGDYEITDRYTAVVAYEGTKTSNYIKGYVITADYSGEVFRKGVTVIRYTVIFTGAEIPAPETSPPSQNGSGGGHWISVLLSALALLGCGACVFFTLKNRKEKLHYEKITEHDYPDAYVDGGDPGVGNGDSGRP
jgi:hypothetical protein